MLRQIPSHLLTEWMAFYTLEPFGYEAELQGFALVSSVVAEVHRDTKKKPKPYTADDFMPKPEEDPEEKPSVFIRLKEYFSGINSGNFTSKT